MAGTVTATGTLTVSDIDSAEEFQAATIGGQHGTLVINTAGEWTYTLDSDFAITGEFEGTDPVITDPIVVYSADGTEHTITIDINEDGIDSSFIPAPDFAVGLGPDAYEVRVDSLSITKFGTEIFRDEFDVGDPTWLSGSVGTYYGSGTESDGKLVLDSDDGFISDDSIISINNYRLNSNTVDGDGLGFELDDQFAATAVFDLDNTADGFGLRLNDPGDGSHHVRLHVHLHHGRLHHDPHLHDVPKHLVDIRIYQHCF